MRARLGLLVAAALVLAACGGSKVKGDGPPAGGARVDRLPGDAIPRAEARSRYGNGPVYEVLGKRYRVMPSSKGKSIIVRVNDRGPFVHNRIIDLSYAAAMKLDMIKDGTSLVEVTAIDVDVPAVGRSSAGGPSGPTPPRPTAVDIQREAPSAQESHRIFVQVGAFGERANAERRLGALSLANIGNAFIHEERTRDRTLYRVRIGPVADVVQYDVLVEELERIGITDPYLIAD